LPPSVPTSPQDKSFLEYGDDIVSINVTGNVDPHQRPW